MIPAWIADMDLPTAPAVAEALRRRADGDLGYPTWLMEPTAGPLAEAFTERMASRYVWHPDPSLVRPFNDLNQALQVLLQIWTAPGDGVAVHTPAYHPFLTTLSVMERPSTPSGSNRTATRGASRCPTCRAAGCSCWSTRTTRPAASSPARS
ncbi:hypothetical protein ACFQYP_04380 [Nonomuraea antimicrobica]